MPAKQLIVAIARRSSRRPWERCSRPRGRSPGSRSRRRSRTAEGSSFPRSRTGRRRPDTGRRPAAGCRSTDERLVDMRLRAGMMLDVLDLDPGRCGRVRRARRVEAVSDGEVGRAAAQPVAEHDAGDDTHDDQADYGDDRDSAGQHAATARRRRAWRGPAGHRGRIAGRHPAGRGRGTAGLPQPATGAGAAAAGSGAPDGVSRSPTSRAPAVGSGTPRSGSSPPWASSGGSVWLIVSSRSSRLGSVRRRARTRPDPRRGRHSRGRPACRTGAGYPAGVDLEADRACGTRPRPGCPAR